MRRLAAALALIALAGCSLAPPYIRAPAPVPQSFPEGPAYSPLQDEPPAPFREDDILRDPRLQALIAQALVNNRDLRVAYANIREARAQVRVTRAAQFPEVGVQGNLDYDRQGGNDSLRAGGSLGVSSFELDLFGRLANATAAERERALSSEANASTVRLALVTDLANAWATHAADSELLALSRRTAADAARSVSLARARLQGGVAPRTDLRQAEQVEFNAEAAVAQGLAAVAQDENLIQLLVGTPFDRALLPRSLAQADAGIAPVPTDSSSDVLLRRPDVLSAEYLLRAANANIGVARAALFPRVSLSGLLNLVSGSIGLALGGNAAQTIFDAGGRRAGVVVSQAQRDAALATYEKAIQTAFREAGDALATAGTIDDRLRAATAQTAAAADLYRLSEARYRGGIESYLPTLDAQRSLYAAQQAEIAVRLAAIRNRLDLYKALGGAPADDAVPATKRSSHSPSAVPAK